jgi:hypothetical protein
MTEKLTIKDLKCSTCPNKEVRKSSGFGRERPRCKITGWFLDIPRPGQSIQTEFVGVVGCASHPLALQVLAAPVIEELGKEEKEQIKIYQNATTMNEEVYHQGIVFGIQRAAKLLKEGVRKP